MKKPDYGSLDYHQDYLDALRALNGRLIEAQDWERYSDQSAIELFRRTLRHFESLSQSMSGKETEMLENLQKRYGKRLRYDRFGSKPQHFIEDKSK